MNIGWSRHPQFCCFHHSWDSIWGCLCYFVICVQCHWGGDAHSSGEKCSVTAHVSSVHHMEVKCSTSKSKPATEFRVRPASPCFLLVSLQVAFTLMAKSKKQHELPFWFADLLLCKFYYTKIFLFAVLDPPRLDWLKIVLVCLLRWFTMKRHYAIVLLPLCLCGIVLAGANQPLWNILNRVSHSHQSVLLLP